MRALRALLSIVVAALSIVVVGAAPSFACSCVMADTADHVKRADVVVSGTVTDVVSMSPRRVTGYVIDVDHVFKGKAGPSVTVLSDGSGSSCGLDNLKAGGSYVVFAGHRTTMDGPDERLWAGLCDGTASTTPELITAVQGAADATRLSAWAWPLALAAGASLVLLTLPLWIRQQVS